MGQSEASNFSFFPLPFQANFLISRLISSWKPSVFLSTSYSSKMLATGKFLLLKDDEKLKHNGISLIRNVLSQMSALEIANAIAEDDSFG